MFLETIDVRLCDVQTRLNTYQELLLHEMIHAFFALYICCCDHVICKACNNTICNRTMKLPLKVHSRKGHHKTTCRHNVRELDMGEEDFHGKPWQDAALVVESSAERGFSRRLDLDRLSIFAYDCS